MSRPQLPACLLAYLPCCASYSHQPFNRVKDWLYGIVQTHPGGNKNTVADDGFEAENILSVFHLVSWPKSLGGAGITPGTAQWENVKSIFPLHNDGANQALLKHLSRRLMLTNDDLDQIRNLFGSKVAFYFAFIQTYLVFLAFPAVAGVVAWILRSKYSLAYGIVTCVWCTVFLEYWKIQQVDLSIRWNVRNISSTKVVRSQFKWESQTFDEATGQMHLHFPRWKQGLRQLLQIPFVALAAMALGIIIAAVFALEVLIAEVYTGSYKNIVVSNTLGVKRERRRPKKRKADSRNRNSYQPFCWRWRYLVSPNSWKA